MNFLCALIIGYFSIVNMTSWIQGAIQECRNFPSYWLDSDSEEEQLLYDNQQQQTDRKSKNISNKTLIQTEDSRQVNYVNLDEIKQDLIYFSDKRNNFGYQRYENIDSGYEDKMKDTFGQISSLGSTGTDSGNISEEVRISVMLV